MSTAALDLGVPVPTLAVAVDERLLSARREVRTRDSQLYGTPIRLPSGDRRAIWSRLVPARLTMALPRRFVTSWAAGH